jgi:stage II sporulation protein M
LSLLAALLIGWHYAARYPFPAQALSIEGVNRETFDQFEGASFLPALSTWGILSHNVQSLLIAGLLATFSFGAIAVVLLMAPIVIIGFITTQAAMAGYNPLLFIAAFVLPHGIFELPAAIIATAMALRLGMAIISPPPGMTVGQGWLRALAHLVKVFVLVVLPLLVVAALIEAHVTPQIVVAVYGD